MKVLEFLIKNPKYVGVLRHAVEWEEDPGNRELSEIGWEPLQVHAPRRDVEELIYNGIARITMHSSKFYHFRLVDREEVKASIADYEKMESEGVEEPFTIPDGVFDDVVGHDEVKKLFLKALGGERVHFLLLGPPSSAKTLFLLCLERLPKTRYILGSRMSKAGLTDYLITYKPRVVMLDEVDKMEAADYGVLLSLCETGRVTEMLYGKVREEVLDTVVFGCTNTLKEIPPEVVSRFEVLRFRPYTDEEFSDVVVNVLLRRGVDRDVANLITLKVLRELGSRDPREAIRISKMAKTREEVDQVVGWLKKYR